jgi:hypothetical protein
MIRMKNRMQAPVNGWQFFQSQTNWNLVEQAPVAQWDFNLAVQSIIAHRKLNPRFNLPTDPASVENELDYANAKRMQSIQGAESYIQSNEDPIPKPQPQRLQGLHAVVGGVSKVAYGAATVIDWIKSGEEAVSQELATKRASICATCEKNAIKAAVSQREGWNLTTPHDEKLKVCTACLCPLKLKVHMPLDAITKRLPKESYEDLVPQCWIRTKDA